MSIQAYCRGIKSSTDARIVSLECLGKAINLTKDKPMAS
jgi:hypothetical protein